MHLNRLLDDATPSVHWSSPLPYVALIWKFWQPLNEQGTWLAAKSGRLSNAWTECRRYSALHRVCAFYFQAFADIPCASPCWNGQVEWTWVAGYTPSWFTCPQTVTHDPSTNWTRRREITLIMNNVLPLKLSQFMKRVLFIQFKKIQISLLSYSSYDENNYTC